MITFFRLSLLLVAGFLVFGGADNVFMPYKGTAVAASNKTTNGDLPFQGWLLVTSDPDWKSMWNDPGRDAPKFREKRQVGLGEEITVLILYANPGVTARGRISLECDIKVIQPDGTPSYDREKLLCADEDLAGPRENVRLAYAHVSFKGELNDPYGTWHVEVTLRDLTTDTAVSLRTSFLLVDRTTIVRIQSFPFPEKNELLLANIQWSLP